MFRRPAAGGSRRLLRRAGILIGVLIALGTALFTGLWLERPGEADAHTRARAAWRRVRSFPRALATEVRKVLEAPLTDPSTQRSDGVPRLSLSIAPMLLRQLEDDRERAIFHRVFIADEARTVPAVLQIDGGAPLDVSVRLKGDWVDHLSGDKWSLRVKTDSAAVFGMRKFSLHRSESRGGHGELLFLDQVRAMGLLAPRYAYVDLWQNGRSIGLMALEEHFRKELLESQRHRESVILALDEDPLWLQRRRNRHSTDRWVRDNYAITHLSGDKLPYRVFDEKRVWRSETLRRFLEQALGLLHGFRRGLIPVDHAFDMEKTGRLLAVANVWGVTHGLINHNLRWYYNPVTRLCEPIAFDNEPTAETLLEPATYRDFTFAQVAASRIGREAYERALQSMLRELEAGGLAALRARELEVLDLLGTEPPVPAALPLDRLPERCRELLEALPSPTRPAPLDSIPPRQMSARLDLVAQAFVSWRDGESGPYLQFQNVTVEPLTVDRVSRRVGDDEREIPLARPLVLPAGGPASEPVRLPVEDSPLERGSYSVLTSAANGRQLESIARRDFPPAEFAAFRTPSDLTAPELAFLEATPDTVRIPTGEHALQQDLVLSADRTLELQPGAHLRCAPGVRIVVHGAVQARGEPDRPVQFTALDTSRPWAGIVVLGKAPSTLEHVEVRGTGRVSDDRWGLTGGVTFYESELTLRNCTFSDTDCEDALNAIRSTLTMEQCTFRGTRSDAVDIDFGSGVLRGLHFSSIGGDGLDVSGSQLEVVQLVAKDIADKGVSVGEGSTLVGSDFDISDCSTGIAVKDSSTARFTDLRVRRVSAAFSAFAKKPEYGPGQLTVTDVLLEDCGLAALVQHGSRIEIDGVEQRSQELAVERLYEAGNR